MLRGRFGIGQICDLRFWTRKEKWGGVFPLENIIAICRCYLYIINPGIIMHAATTSNQGHEGGYQQHYMTSDMLCHPKHDDAGEARRRCNTALAKGMKFNATSIKSTKLLA